MGQEARGRWQRPKLEQSVAAAGEHLWVRRMEADAGDGALMRDDLANGFRVIGVPHE